MAYSYLLLFSEADRLLSTKPRMTLLQIAELLKVGSQTLGKAIKKVSGKSFTEYQKAKILERTGSIIANGAGLLEKQIAAEIGYSSPDAFSRFIKLTTGVNLREIRRRGQFPPCVRGTLGK
jgi:YesN/AraC family two-component response regulator